MSATTTRSRRTPKHSHTDRETARCERGVRVQPLSPLRSYGSSSSSRWIVGWIVVNHNVDIDRTCHFARRSEPLPLQTDPVPYLAVSFSATIMTHDMIHDVNCCCAALLEYTDTPLLSDLLTFRSGPSDLRLAVGRSALLAARRPRRPPPIPAPWPWRHGAAPLIFVLLRQYNLC